MIPKKFKILCEVFHNMPSKFHLSYNYPLNKMKALYFSLFRYLFKYYHYQYNQNIDIITFIIDNDYYITINSFDLSHSYLS